MGLGRERTALLECEEAERVGLRAFAMERMLTEELWRVNDGKLARREMWQADRGETPTPVFTKRGWKLLKTNRNGVQKMQKRKMRLQLHQNKRNIVHCGVELEDR
jgi:hypothetical protein